METVWRMSRPGLVGLLVPGPREEAWWGASGNRGRGGLKQVGAHRGAQGLGRTLAPAALSSRFSRSPSVLLDFSK